jgi:hypothetical protein
MRDSFLLAALAAAVCPAQSQTFTAPPGYETVEGPTAQTVYVPWYAAAGGRYQWTDGSQRGRARPNIHRLDLRRDGLAPASTSFGPRATTLTVVMGHCRTSQLGNAFAANYVGATTTCLNRLAFNVPSHVAPPANPPAPWTLVVPFAVNFSYDGVDDLLWEVIAENSAPAGEYSTDAHAGGAGTSSALGTGCGAFLLGRGGPLARSAAQVRLQVWATGGPLRRPGALFFGLTDPATDYGGLLCARLRAGMDLVVPVQTTQAGTIASAAAPLAFDLPGPPVPTTVYTQFVVLDPLAASPIPVRLSSAASWALVEPVPVSLLWYDGPNPAARTTGTRSGPVAIARFWH